MKIEICNLNDISRAEIDLRPLTIFIGTNNMGKTWIAYILSGIFGSRGWEEYSQAYARGQLPKSYPSLDAAIEDVLAKGNATIDLYKLAEEYGEIYFQNVADYARNWMNDYMETQLANFSNMKVSINLAEIKAVFLEQVEKYPLLIRVAGGLFTIRKEQDDKTLYAFTSIEGEEQLAEKLSVEERKAKAKNDLRIQKYIDLAEILENQILSGRLAFSTPEPDPRRDILFQATQDVTLEIPIVSSMIKELAPLVFYLRYLAEPGELLIIDEPEMNLHPVVQTQIIEFLAMLVNAGLHVLITTHSTYVIDHLTNLMDAYKHKNQDEIAEMFLLEQKEAFISQEKVSVYLVEDGKVKNVLDLEGIIDWKTFSDVTTLVERIHFELLGA